MRINKKKVVLVLTFIGVLLLGGILGVRLQQSNLQHQYLLLQKWNKLNAVLNFIDREYVDEIVRKEVEDKTISFAIKSLDPHSVYIPASEMKDANEALDGNFEGVGITFNMMLDTVIVMSTIAGGPSERVGVMAGDRIITVNDSLVAGKKIAQDSIVRLLRGKAGSKVTIGVKRYGESKLVDIAITRGKIPIKSMDIAYMINSKTAYLKISKFSRTTFEEFHDASKKMQEQGMQSMILDLRGNTGGYLEQAVAIANEFLPAGTLIVYTQGKARDRREQKSNGRGALKGIEIAILLDEGSASASEVLAGAIQDNDRGTIIGRRSFGKGLVQEPIEFNDGSGMRLTVARYYTPTGRCIQRPYNLGSDEDYYLELQRRYEHGELNFADSIHQNDSLRYLTPSGKIVYGGGGIMPDIFVPIDTVGINQYYKNVNRKNLIYRFALQFSDRNRAGLNHIHNFAQLSRYFKRRNFMAQFITYASNNGVTASSDAEIKECAPIITAQIQAYIGRTTSLDDEGFYPFLAKIDNTLQEAITTLKNTRATTKNDPE
ncbi:MAG: S41 family peptidase [Bacteroidales bacterium]